MTQSIAQNIYAPFPFAFHLTFCMISTIFLLVQLGRKKYFYYVLLIFAIDISLITQFTQKDNIIFALGISELILVITIVSLMLVCSHKAKKKLKTKLLTSDSSKYNVVINQAEDVFKDAFSDDDL